MSVWFRVYLGVTAVAVALSALMLVPGVVIVMAAYTFGLGVVIVLPILNAAFWLVVFTPAVLGVRVNWRAGVAIAAVTVVAVMTVPRRLPEPGHEGVALLELPVAADGPVKARSVEVEAYFAGLEAQNEVDAAVDALKRNQDLEWIRLRRLSRVTLFHRKDGILYEVREDPDAAAQKADVVVTVASPRHVLVWGNAGLSPWRVEGAEGYLIQEGRRPLARNLSLSVLRAVWPIRLGLTGVGLDSTYQPRIEFVRAPYGSVARDPERRLEDDLRALGLWPEDSSLDPANPTSSSVAAVDARLEEMLKDKQLARLEGARSRSATPFETQVLEHFEAQIAARVGIAQRIDLIARLEHSELSGLNRGAILEVAQETPALMARMVDLYYADLLADDRHYGRWQRVERQGYASFARAIGRDRERFLLALGGGKAGKREFLLKHIFRFAVDDPYAILRTVFFPSPPGDPLEARFVEGYRAVWDEPWRREAILENLRRGTEVNRSDMQKEADMVVRLIASRDEVPRDVLIGLVRDWVLTRRSPILHDPETTFTVLRRLDEIGADELHGALMVYFADLITHRPHWMDAP